MKRKLFFAAVTFTKESRILSPIQKRLNLVGLDAFACLLTTNCLSCFLKFFPYSIF